MTVINGFENMKAAHKYLSKTFQGNQGMLGGTFVQGRTGLGQQQATPQIYPICIFKDSIKDDITKDHPDITDLELNEIVYQKWRELKPEEKKELISQANDNRNQHQGINNGLQYNNARINQIKDYIVEPDHKYEVGEEIYVFSTERTRLIKATVKAISKNFYAVDYAESSNEVSAFTNTSRFLPINEKNTEVYNKQTNMAVGGGLGFGAQPINQQAEKIVFRFGDPNPIPNPPPNQQPFGGRAFGNPGFGIQGNFAPNFGRGMVVAKPNNVPATNNDDAKEKKKNDEEIDKSDDNSDDNQEKANKEETKAEETKIGEKSNETVKRNEINQPKIGISKDQPTKFTFGQMHRVKTEQDTEVATKYEKAMKITKATTQQHPETTMFGRTISPKISLSTALSQNNTNPGETNMFKMINQTPPLIKTDSSLKNTNSSDYIRFKEMFEEDFRSLSPNTSTEEFNNIMLRIYSKIPWNH